MKKLISILIMAIMTLGLNRLLAHEATVGTLTVNSGTQTSTCVPIQGNCNYGYSVTQFIIDDEALDPARGGYITEMAFHVAEENCATSGHYEIFVTEIAENRITIDPMMLQWKFLDVGGVEAASVLEAINIEDHTWTIPFDRPKYFGGWRNGERTHLMVTIRHTFTTTAFNLPLNFYGVEYESEALYYASTFNSDGYQLPTSYGLDGTSNFSPMTTITYTAPSLPTYRHTVNGNTQTSQDVPVQSSHNSEYTTTQFIIDGDRLESFRGNDITQMTFHLASHKNLTMKGDYEIYLSEIEENRFHIDPMQYAYDFIDIDGTEPVRTLESIHVIDSTWTVIFNQPWHFNGWHNSNPTSLLVTIRHTPANSNSPSPLVFLGEEYESEPLYHVSSFSHNEAQMPNVYDNLGRTDFSPMTTISYLPDTPPIFNVTYAANGAVGEVPVDHNSPYTYGSTVTVLEPNGLSMRRHHFTGWLLVTRSDSIVLQPGETFTIYGDMTLEAQWEHEPWVYYTHTVNIGKVRSDVVPILGPWNDEYVVTQFILRDALIENIRGADISQLKFHLERDRNTQLEGHYEVYVTETPENWYYVHPEDASPLNRWPFYSYTEDDLVCTLESINIEDYTWTIPFDQPKYFNGWIDNTPSSLLVTILHTPGSAKKTLTFLGQDDSRFRIVSIFNRDQNEMPTYYDEYGALRCFSPMTTITYSYPINSPTYTVSYDANEATSGEVPDIPTDYAGGTQITIADNTGELQEINHLFTGWNTRADGNGTHYDAGSQMVVSDNTVLYAELKRIWTVTYRANGVAGEAPIDTLSPYIEGNILTVLAPDSLYHPNRRFMGWLWQDIGIGYRISQPGDTIVVDQDIIFLAQWETEYTVAYSANGATSGTAPTDPNSPYLINELAVVLGPGDLVKENYRFCGWRLNTLNGGMYSEGDTIRVSSNIILIADWRQPYSITFLPNGADSGTVPIDENLYTNLDLVTLPDNTGNLTLDGYCWYGWNTTANGNGLHYNPGSQITIQTNTSLYADWRYRITYDANGATSGTVPTDDIWHLPSSMANALHNTGGLDKENYYFIGWNTEPDGTGTHYSVGSPIYTHRNTTLYAEWSTTLSTIAEVQAISNNNTSTNYNVTLDGWRVTFANSYFPYNYSINYASAYLTDGSGLGIWVTSSDLMNLGFEAGDRLSGTVSCTIITNPLGYNTIQGLNSTTAGLTVTHDESEITPSNTTIGDIGMAQLGALVRIEDRIEADGSSVRTEEVGGILMSLLERVEAFRDLENSGIDGAL